MSDKDVGEELLTMAVGETRRVRGVEVRRGVKKIFSGESQWSVARRSLVSIEEAVREVLDREQRREQKWTHGGLVSRLEVLRQGETFGFGDVLVVREATAWFAEGLPEPEESQKFASSHALAQALLKREEETQRAKKRETKMKKPTRMMALWDGIDDDELRHLAAWGATSDLQSERRMGEAARAELERREKATKHSYAATPTTAKSEADADNRGDDVNLTHTGLVARLESMVQDETFTVCGATVTREATVWRVEWVDGRTSFSYSRNLADALLAVEAEAQRTKKNAYISAARAGLRWSGWSDEEVGWLADSYDPDGSGSAGAHDLEDEIEREHKRRQTERNAEPTYQGPGYYRNRNTGSCLHVVGTVAVGGVRYVLVGSSLQDPDVWGFPVRSLEGRNADGERAYQYSETKP